MGQCQSGLLETLPREKPWKGRKKSNRSSYAQSKRQSCIWGYRDKKIAAHDRCWQRGQRIETASHKEQVKKLKRKLWLDKDISAFSSLGSEAVAYLEALARTRQPIKKNVSKLLCLKDDYGAVSVIYAIKKALIHNAIGADYIENILYQEMTPKRHHPPVRLKKEALNNIRLPEPSLVEYDAHAIKRNKQWISNRSSKNARHSS
jgi:hypothetical protein